MDPVLFISPRCCCNSHTVPHHANQFKAVTVAIVVVLAVTVVLVLVVMVIVVIVVVR